MDHGWDPKMQCDVFLLPKSVIAGTNTKQMATRWVQLSAENAGVGGTQWEEETIGSWQEKGGLTTQQKENKVRERVWEIAQSMSISNKEGTCPKQWDILINSCVTSISDLASKKPFWKRSMADKTILDGEKLVAALDEFAEVCLCQWKSRIIDILTKNTKFVYIGMYFITPMLLLLFLMMCRYRRQWGRNLGSHVFADTGTLGCLDKYPFLAI